MKAFVLTFDKNDPTEVFDYSQFHNKLTTLTQQQGLITWWHYLESTYLLITTDNASSSSITQFLIVNAPNKRFFVVKVDLKDHGGWLPQEAWDWIKNYVNVVR